MPIVAACVYGRYRRKCYGFIVGINLAHLNSNPTVYNAVLLMIINAGDLFFLYIIYTAYCPYKQLQYFFQDKKR